MARGRRPSVSRLLKGLDGSEEARQRLELILDTLAGHQTLADAAGQLGLSDRHLHTLRMQLLQQALYWLQPRPPGRPEQRTLATTLDPRAEEIQRLRVELNAARVREEIALALPHLLRRRRPDRATPRNRRKRR